MRSATAVPRFLLLIGIIAVISGEAFSDPVDPPRANLRWKTNSITVAVSDSLIKRNSSIKYGSDTLGALQRSFTAWESVADISFKRVFTRDQSVSPAGQSGDGVSLITIAQTPENVLLFTHGIDDASAKTRVFYDRAGSITEADIVLNPFLQFSTDGTPGTIDLESTLTHEIGHLLGLYHSAVLGSAMYENYGRNGPSGRDVNFLRLGEQDIAAVRSLYGSRDDNSCCGRIDGTLTVSPTRAITNLFVWAEDSETGRVMAEGAVNSSGKFSLGGLSEGKYKLFAQDGGRAEKVSSAQSLGDVEVEKDHVKTISHRFRSVLSGFDLQYLGLNGGISTLSIPIQAGRSSQISLGGRGINEKQITVSSDSSLIKILPGATQTQEYGDGITVLNLEIHVDEETPPGEYSLFAETDGGAKRFLVGSLVITPQR
jgi:hypothetical protein